MRGRKLFKNFFKNKTLIVQNEEINLKHGFYDIRELQDNFDALVVTAKLIGYNVNAFWAKNKTGFFLTLSGPSGYAEFNFYTKGKRRRTNYVHIDFGDNLAIFSFGDKKINSQIQEMMRWL